MWGCWATSLRGPEVCNRVLANVSVHVLALQDGGPSLQRGPGPGARKGQFQIRPYRSTKNWRARALVWLGAGGDQRRLPGGGGISGVWTQTQKCGPCLVTGRNLRPGRGVEQGDVEDMTRHLRGIWVRTTGLGRPGSPLGSEATCPRFALGDQFPIAFGDMFPVAFFCLHGWLFTGGASPPRRAHPPQINILLVPTAADILQQAYLLASQLRTCGPEHPRAWPHAAQRIRADAEQQRVTGRWGGRSERVPQMGALCLPERCHSTACISVHGASACRCRPQTGAAD